MACSRKGPAALGSRWAMRARITGDVVAPVIDEKDWGFRLVILLDTHVWLWWAQGEAGELPITLRDAIFPSSPVPLPKRCRDIAVFLAGE